MSRVTSGLSRPVLKWVSQVAASLGATLAATAIWSAVPHPSPSPAARPELTSGGKFAARAVAPDAAVPVAYDGLDTMPLPRVVAGAAPVVAASAEAPHRAPSDATVAPAQERSARALRPAHPPTRAEARHVEPARAVAVPTPVALAGVSQAVPEAAGDEGLLHRAMPDLLPRVLPAIASTARDAWAATAAAGDALAARVVPQVP